MSMFDRLVAEQRRAAALGLLTQEGGPCRIKLCGMFRDEDIAALNEAGPDLCGFIFNFPKSHRNVTGSLARQLFPQVSERIYKTLVLVDQPWQKAAYYTASLGADIVQLHGKEDDDYMHALRSRMHVGIIKAFTVRTQADVEAAKRSTADMVLLDAGQGSGTTFDWSLIEGVGACRPFMLAGGLGPDNVAEAIRTLHPWGVDMSSGIETNGVKDPLKMASAVSKVRECGRDATRDVE